MVNSPLCQEIRQKRKVKLRGKQLAHKRQMNFIIALLYANVNHGINNSISILTVSVVPFFVLTRHFHKFICALILFKQCVKVHVTKCLATLNVLSFSLTTSRNDTRSNNKNNEHILFACCFGHLFACIIYSMSSVCTKLHLFPVCVLRHICLIDIRFISYFSFYINDNSRDRRSNLSSHTFYVLQIT